MSRTAPPKTRVKLFFKHFDQTFPENLIQVFRGILLFCLCFTLLHSWLFGFLDENVGKIGPEKEQAVEGPNPQKTYGLANPWFPAIGRYIYPHNPCQYTIHGCYGIDSVDVLMQLDDQLALSPARCKTFERVLVRSFLRLCTLFAVYSLNSWNACGLGKVLFFSFGSWTFWNGTGQKSNLNFAPNHWCESNLWFMIFSPFPQVKDSTYLRNLEKRLDIEFGKSPSQLCTDVRMLLYSLLCLAIRIRTEPSASWRNLWKQTDHHLPTSFSHLSN